MWVLNELILDEIISGVCPETMLTNWFLVVWAPEVKLWAGIRTGLKQPLLFGAELDRSSWTAQAAECLWPAKGSPGSHGHHRGSLCSVTFATQADLIRLWLCLCKLPCPQVSGDLVQWLLLPGPRHKNQQHSVSLVLRLLSFYQWLSLL